MAIGENTRASERALLRAPLAVGWRAASSTRITRRGFLAGGATTPFALTSVLADETDFEAILEFDLSDDGVTLQVRVLYKPRVGNKPSRKPSVWPLRAASFGLDAWFELHAEDGALGRRFLKVNNASFGESVGLTLSFVFTPNLSPRLALSNGVDASAPYATGWLLRLETSIWAATRFGPARWASEDVGFADFVTGTPLEGSASGEVVGQRLNQMFDDRVDTDRKSAVPATIRFIGQALWVVMREGVSAAEGFDSRLSASEFQFGWYLDNERKPFFFGFARPEVIRITDEFVLGDLDGLHLVVTRREPHAKLREQWEVRRVATPLLRQTYSKLPFPETF